MFGRNSSLLQRVIHLGAASSEVSTCSRVFPVDCELFSGRSSMHSCEKSCIMKISLASSFSNIIKQAWTFKALQDIRFRWRWAFSAHARLVTIIGAGGNPAQLWSIRWTELVCLLERRANTSAWLPFAKAISLIGCLVRCALILGQMATRRALTNAKAFRAVCPRAYGIWWARDSRHVWKPAFAFVRRRILG